MSLSLIVAMSQNRVIGKNNKLPWHLPEDLKQFKKITMGHPIIMGRKTFESIGKPLPGRENIVITRDSSYRAEGIRVTHSLQEAIQSFKVQDELFVIGGADIFKIALPFAHKIYLTLIAKNIEGDTFFPELNWKKEFKKMEESPLLLSEKEKLPYQFITLVRST